jgi:hypothetical protein
MTQHTTLSVRGHIEMQVFDRETLAETYDDWESLSKEAKHSRLHNGTVDPVQTRETPNVTTESLHQYFVDNLDPDNTSAAANISAAWVGLGDGGGSGTTVTDTDLNNRLYEETVTDHADNGDSLIASTFLDSTEGNGQTFDEIGLFSGNPANLAQDDVFLLNHATFSPVTKDSSRTITFDVTLTFSDN